MADHLEEDLILDGNCVRDRFLTAFILRQGGLILERHRPQEVRPSPSNQDVLFLDLEAAGLEPQDRTMVERPLEPLYLRVAEPWFPGDDDV